MVIQTRVEEVNVEGGHIQGAHGWRSKAFPRQE